VAVRCPLSCLCNVERGTWRSRSATCFVRIGAEAKQQEGAPCDAKADCLAREHSAQVCGPVPRPPQPQVMIVRTSEFAIPIPHSSCSN
jgi:hypothetical protein